MALPQIVTPEFETQLPSNNQIIKFRPFLVKEEKILLMANEGQDQKEIMGAVLKILQGCIETEGVVITELPLFDIEWLFLQVRGKSVGEVIPLDEFFKASLSLSNSPIFSISEPAAPVKLLPLAPSAPASAEAASDFSIPFCKISCCFTSTANICDSNETTDSKETRKGSIADDIAVDKADTTSPPPSPPRLGPTEGP